ncbi:hypothetical protein BDP27DRAFT_1215926 [Rhodocollybia butyracea]|uniref:CCHC-type domain-containing protein n=1 Tax=Rhodocollybia butyracea TaxID=206335 RepID=A0A9P5UCQ8_9AGAR|nr:hypothetical protein BDP27DRAFT_1215926 [Rhodocollybia butyracea]
MQAWVGDIHGQAFEMQMAGVDISDHDVILALTLGLPPTYDPVIISFDSMSLAALTLDHVITHLLNEETRQGTCMHTAPATANGTTADNGALAVTSTSRHPLSKVVCFFCGTKGHYHDTCSDCKAWLAHRGKKAGDANIAAAFDEVDEWSNNAL